MNRTIREIALTPSQIENITEKGVDVQAFYRWRYLIHLQTKRKHHKNKLIAKQRLCGMGFSI
jgi:hypothetical protein